MSAAAKETLRWQKKKKQIKNKRGYVMTETTVKRKSRFPTRPALGMAQEDANSVQDSFVSRIPGEEDGYAFRSTPLPPDGLALRSVAIVDDVPELRFGASHKVPTITEEDVAIALRLASEGIRPEFFFVGISPEHPFFGRQFNHYKPQWLRGTSVGNLLFDADWIMKCLSFGARSNDEKSMFWGWQKTSQLKDLATVHNFPRDNPSGSIIMSCESAKVQKDENEIAFPEEPKMKIVDDTSSLYSKYITEIYPSVAYHDEPRFLKMQELIKLILAAEWLTEKGVKVSKKWMMEHTAKPKAVVKAIEGAKSYQDKVRSPPEKMIPSQPATVKVPSSDVTPQVEAEEYRHLGKCGVGYRYGWHDFGNKEMAMFDEDGALCLRQQSLKMVFNNHVTMEGQPTKKVSLRLSCPLPPNIPTPPMTELGDEVMKHFEQVSHFETTGVFGHLLAHVNVADNAISKDGAELKVEMTIQPCPVLALPQWKETIFMKASVNNYDLLYGHMDPNQPIIRGIPGWCEEITPNVKSWNELFRETVPWPCVWQVPYLSVGKPVAGGGVTTCNIPTTVSSIASSCDSQLAVQAQWQAVKQVS